MSVKIRLSRIGKKHVPFHRIIVVDSRKKRDAAYLDNLGTYDAQKSQIIKFNEELYNKWLDKGAQPTDSARKIYKQFKKIGLESITKKVVKPKVQPAPKQKVTAEATEAKSEVVSAKTDKSEKPVKVVAKAKEVQKETSKEEPKAKKTETKKEASEPKSKE